MNGLGVPGTLAERQELKRKLMAELTLVRSQKADVLRQIQAIAKKQRTVGPPPKTSGLPPETRRQAIDVEHHRRQEALWQSCTKIMQDLLKNSTVKLYFGEPVRRDYAPNYYDVIKKPMDLGTIKRKLDTKKYSDVYGFLSDVRLCFSNCRTFNPVGNHVRTVGDDASDKFERKWALGQIEAKWEEERQRYQLELERLEAESKSLPEKIKEVTTELADLTRKAEARATPQPPGPGRDMSFEEKRKLSHALSNLNYDQLAAVMEIVEKDPTIAGQQEEIDEFELDLDVLGRETLWKLHSIVEEANAQAPSKHPPSTAANAAAAPAAGAAAAQPAAAPAAPAAAADGGQRQADSGSSSDGSDSEEVGSKGNAGSTFGDHGETKKPHLPPGGHDLTTFVSATGPGMQPQILKNTGHKKDVQLQNANAWASLTTAAPAPAGAAVPAGGAARQPDAAAEAEEEEDNLWSEFQGREQQQRQQEEQKKALEEEERRNKEAEAEALRKQAEEAKAAKQRAEQERQQAIEQQREREAAQLQDLQKAAAEEGNQPDILHIGVGHDSGANLEALGLVPREDDEEMDEDEEEI